MKTKTIFSLMALLVGAVLLLGTTTTRTLTGSGITNPNGVPRYSFTAVTLAAATDTAIFSFANYAPDAARDSTVQITVSVASANGDSTDIGVRWQSSWDNSNWETQTIGTDSTSWVSTTTGTSYTPYTKFINLKADGFGIKPYNRIMVVGLTGNLAGTAVDLDVGAFD